MNFVCHFKKMIKSWFLFFIFFWGGGAKMFNRLTSDRFSAMIQLFRRFWVEPICSAVMAFSIRIRSGCAWQNFQKLKLLNLQSSRMKLRCETVAIESRVWPPSCSWKWFIVISSPNDFIYLLGMLRWARSVVICFPPREQDARAKKITNKTLNY